MCVSSTCVSTRYLHLHWKVHVVDGVLRRGVKHNVRSVVPASQTKHLVMAPLKYIIYIYIYGHSDIQLSPGAIVSVICIYLPVYIYARTHIYLLIIDAHNRGCI